MHESRSQMTLHSASARRSGVAVLAFGIGSSLLLAFAGSAGAVEPTVGLGAAGNYSVLAGSTVTNTGPSVLNGSLGVSPGSSLTGWGGAPNGTVVPPAVTDDNNAAAAQGQFDLNAAYTDAMGRSVSATEPADLTGLTLGGGVYNASTNGALQVTGTLTLDGANDPSTVFIFTTDSSLTIGPGSSINVIRGAQECNIFWRVGSSASLDTGAVFRGNILAQTSISVNDSVVVHGRALAQTGGVTLINDTFLNPTCATSVAAPTTVAAPATTVPGGGGGGVSPTTAAAGPGAGATTTTLGLTVGIVGPPRTGVAPVPAHDFPWTAVLVAGVGGAAMLGVIVRRRQLAHAKR
jgi:hypothetical protein